MATFVLDQGYSAWTAHLQEVVEAVRRLRTERNHMSSILKKVEGHSQLQALVFALRHGLVEIS